VRAEFEQVQFEPVTVPAALEHAVGDEVRGDSVDGGLLQPSLPGRFAEPHLAGESATVSGMSSIRSLADPRSALTSALTRTSAGNPVRPPRALVVSGISQADHVPSVVPEPTRGKGAGTYQLTEPVRAALLGLSGGV
jgi:hypothetical protein